MANIKKIRLKHGTAYELRWSVCGIRYSRYFAPPITLSEVKQIAADIDRDKAYHRAGLVVPMGNITLRDLAHRYTEARRHEVDPWRELLAMRKFTEFAGNVFAGSVTAELLHQYRDILLELRMPTDPSYPAEQRIRRGVNKDLKFLRVVFNWAHRAGLVPEKVFERVQLYKAQAVRPDVLTRAEVEAVYEHLPVSGPWRVLYRVMQYSGLRRSEVLRLRPENIDLGAKIIRLPRTKNGEAVTVPMHPRLVELLADNFLDTSIKPDRLTRTIRRAMTAAGVDKRMPCHILRHTVGARVIERYLTDGDGERIAQEVLRHKSRVMTRHYTQIVQEQIGGALADVDL